jgi:hypothetical protein
MNRSDRIIPVGAEPPSMDPPRQPPPPRAPDRPVAKRGRPRRKGDLARRFGLYNAVVDYAIRDLHRSELVVFLILWRHAKADGTVSASIADSGPARRLLQTGDSKRDQATDYQKAVGADQTRHPGRRADALAAGETGPARGLTGTPHRT